MNPGALPYPSWLSPEIAPGVPLRWYGVMYVVAFVTTFFLFRREAERSGLTRDRDEIALFFYWTVLGALVGGRLFYVLVIDEHAMEFLRRPWLILWPFRDGRFTGIQGMSYYGGLIGVIVAVVLFARVRRVSLLDWSDTLALATPLGYTFGRLGNFINGELAGRVTGVSWGVVFPQVPRFPVEEAWVPAAAAAGISIPDGTLMVNLPRHPSQLYEAFLEGIVLWLLLWFVIRPKRPFPGACVSLYLAGYGLARFFAEYFKALGEVVQMPTSILSIEPDQFISLGVFGAGVILFIVLRIVAPPNALVETFERTGEPPRRSGPR